MTLFPRIAMSAVSIGALALNLAASAANAAQADTAAIFRIHAAAVHGKVRASAQPTTSAVTPLTGSFTFIDVPGTDVTRPFGIAPHATGGPVQIAGFFGAAAINGPLATPSYGFTLSAEFGARATLHYRPVLATRPSVVAHAINDSGGVAGWWVGKNGHVHGYTVAPGMISEVTVPGATDVYCNGISNTGVIAGSWDGPADGLEHAFLSQGGKVTLLPDYPGAQQTVATGSNASGMVAGFIIDAAGNAHSAVYAGGTWTVFDPPSGGFSLALGINASGAITGQFCPDAACEQPAGYLLQNGAYQSLTVPGESSNNGTTLLGISDDGLITGSYEDVTNTFQHGFLFTPGAAPK